MRRTIFVLIIIVLFLALMGNSSHAEDNDGKISGILDKTTYNKVAGIKVIKATFQKTGSDRYWDMWESDIKVKSCYTMRMECSGVGRFETEDADYFHGSHVDYPYLGVFPIKVIDKESIGESKGTIKLRKDSVNKIISFHVEIKCDPVYTDHPNKYPPNHKYWKQFLPAKHGCK